MARRVRLDASRQRLMGRRVSIRLLLTTVFAVLQVWMITVVFFELLAEGFISFALTVSAVLIAALDAWEQLRPLFTRTKSRSHDCVHADCRDLLVVKLDE